MERTRVGQITDYERLVLEIWTDGAVTPLDAIQEAAEGLVNHFFLFSNMDSISEPGIDRSPAALSPETYQTPIERLDLSPRTMNCLKRAHIGKVGELLQMSDQDLLKIRNFGEKSLTELRDKLSEQGITNPYAESDTSEINHEAITADNASVDDSIGEEEN